MNTQHVSEKKCGKCSHPINRHKQLGLYSYCQVDKCKCCNPLFTVVEINSAEEMFALGMEEAKTGQPPKEIVDAKSGKTKTKFGVVIRP